MTTVQSDNSNTSCIACHEPIRLGASVCRYCGSSQKRGFWKKLSNILKWVGGVVTVISLVVGMVTLSGYYQDWRERHDAVAELVDAADWLIKTEDYGQAWQMYEEALKLVPSSAKTLHGQFRLAKVWLRNFSSSKETADEILNRITSILYRGLRKADADEVATTLAHVGWAQVIRAGRSMAVSVDVDAVFQEALRSSPDNVYANAMLGYWLLIGRGATVQDITLAQSKFALALSSNKERDFVRQLQFSNLVDLTFGKDDEVEQAALIALLKASFSMMQNGETKPIVRFRKRIMEAYGFMGKAENIEASFNALPTADHLAVHEWLMKDLDFKGLHSFTQALYIKARLTEALGKKQEALEKYQSLLTESNSTKQLDGLINKGIYRLTGELPERAKARTYNNDPVDEKNPWDFHLDTLVHFDPKRNTTNSNQALEYFENVATKPHEKLPDLVNLLHKEFNRFWKVVRKGEEITRLNPSSLDFTLRHLDNARFNLVRLSYVYTRASIVIDELDKAIAVLGDMKRFTDKLDDDWVEERAWMAFELARAYAIRADSTANDTDSSNAVKFLRISIEENGVNGEITSWDEIKSDTFKSIWNDSGYKELIRGR